MANNEPLDHLVHQAKTLTAREVINRLQKHGFYNAYETGDGAIKIKGQPSLQCTVKKNENNTWVPDVSVEWLSAYVLIPSVAFFMLAQVAGLSGIVPLVGSALAGLGVGTVLVQSKKKAAVQRLEAALSE